MTQSPADLPAAAAQAGVSKRSWLCVIAHDLSLKAFSLQSIYLQSIYLRSIYLQSIYLSSYEDRRKQSFYTCEFKGGSYA